MQSVYSLLDEWGHLFCGVVWSYYASNIVGSSFVCNIVGRIGIEGLAMVLVVL